jgi:predicted nucleotide-binding protein (sugar kinase/HSP70/actin superfamily)
MNTQSNIELPSLKTYSTEEFNCKGCENQCLISKLTFNDGKSFFTGNKCEKVYTNKGADYHRGENHYKFKNKQLDAFIKPYDENRPLTIGIPRGLNMWENFPFWSELLYNCGFNVVISRPSTFKQYEKGIGTVMSDNICFPAKLMNGHIYDLLAMKNIDRIFYPFVVYEKKEHPQVANSYNCPIVTAYSEVIKSAIDTAAKYNIPLDDPTINFDDEKLLKSACWNYLKTLGTKKSVFEKAFKNALLTFDEYKISLKDNCQRIFDNAIANNRIVILVAGRPYHSDQLIQHKLTDMIADFDVDIISDDIVRESDYSHFSELNTVSQWTYTNRIMRAAQFAGKTDGTLEFVEITSFGCGPDAFVVDEVSEILRANGKNLTLLKVDDVNNIGSLKLRIRSLLESLKFRNAEKIEKYALRSTPVYKKEDRKKTILAPFFSEFYSPFIKTFFEMMGYKLYNMRPSDEDSIKYGLQFANNEICYPATLVIGDIIRELKENKWNPNEIVIGMTQTGGQCRATNYIMLIKKAMLAAGYDNIPVISVAFSDGMNNQQEFVLEWKPLIKIAIYAVLYADSISRMYYSAAAHENQKGSAKILRNKYIDNAQVLVEHKDIDGLMKMLKQATNDFNAIIDTTKNPPKIGIVGEIYVKYNSIGHKHVVSWLVEQGIEVVVPSILTLFTQYFFNKQFNAQKNLEKGSISRNILIKTIEYQLNSIMKKVTTISKNYKLWNAEYPLDDVHNEAKEASEIISLGAQFGEGWLIPAEIATFHKHGINNVISLQPFGCIANHIISKGIEKGIKQHFPKMNLLFLDFDSGVSDVNVHNRLHFMIKNAIEQLESQH